MKRQNIFFSFLGIHILTFYNYWLYILPLSLAITRPNYEVTTMAKDEKKKKKKKKGGRKWRIHKKLPLSITLPQDHRNDSDLSEAEKTKLYQAFRKRCETKSNHKYVDEGQRPELLRVHFLGSINPTTTEYLVMVGSFEPITSSKKADTEIGFRVKLKIPFMEEIDLTLEVYHHQFKAMIIVRF